MQRRWSHLLGGLTVAAIIASACGGDDDAQPAPRPADTTAAPAEEPVDDTTDDVADTTEPPADEPADDVTEPTEPPADEPADVGEPALGSAEVVARLDALYHAAIDAGATEVVVYGPGEDDKVPVYEAFMARYPEISVTGEYLVGPNMESKLNAEFASGQHFASLIQSGDTSVVPKIPSDASEGLLEAFDMFTIEGLDPQFADSALEYIFAPSASTFGILYNTDMLSADEAPAGWDDLVDPAWTDRLVWDDPTRFGSAFGLLNKMLYNDQFGTPWVEALAATEPYLEASAPAGGSAVATGQFPVDVGYPYSFYLRDAERGAPVALVFPVEGGQHLSPHYVGLLRGAPSPDAAQLLANWMFTPEGQAAIAEVGYYPTMPDMPGPEGHPPVNELELLVPIPLDEVNALSVAHLDVVKDIWDVG